MATHDEIMSVLNSGAAARSAGRFDEASERMEQALAMCGPDQDYERADVLRWLGELARSKRDLSAAQAHYERAVTLLRTSDDRLKFAHTVRHLGDVHRKQQHWPQAEKCYVEALQIYRAHPLPNALDLANAIRAYAVLRSETGEHEEARPLWIESRDLYQSLGIDAGVEEYNRRFAGT